MSPILFLIVQDDMLSKAIDQSNRGIRWNFTSHLDDPDYADDICLISTKESGMQGKINDLVNEYLVAGLQLNTVKTKALKINVSNTGSNYIAGDVVIEIVVSFTYLGSIIMEAHWMMFVAELPRPDRRRSASASTSNRTKILLFNSNVKSVLLNGCEPWLTSRR